MLHGFLNYGTEGNWILLIVFILYSLRPLGPYVILVVLGTAGSAKSTFSRLLRLLIDPSSVPTQALPRAIADLMITASNSHLLVFDNVRTLSVELSDALCQLATGGGSCTRTLYTNSEETLVHVTKPCILNGSDDVASQPDLVSRCILMELPTITVRRTEEDLNSKFAASIDAIFAGLMDTLSKTPTDLLAALREVATRSQANDKVWPMSPHSLSKRLKKMEPAPRACGVGVTFQHSGNRTIQSALFSSQRCPACSRHPGVGQGAAP